MNAAEIVSALAPNAVLVGSASRLAVYRDLDFVVNERGLAIAKKLFPGGWDSAFVGNVKTFDTDPPLEVFVYWYGPDYATLVRKCKRELVQIEVLGVAVRAWPTETR